MQYSHGVPLGMIADPIPLRSLFRKFTYRITTNKQNKPAVIIKFSDDPDRNELFGTPPGEQVIIEGENILKLPHDLVHACFSVEPESNHKLFFADGGYITPDIIIIRETEDRAIKEAHEIKTLAKNDRALVARTMNIAVENYKKSLPQPLGEGKIDKINVYVVTPSSVYDLHGDYRDYTRVEREGDQGVDHSQIIKTLTEAYLMGKRIVNEVHSAFGFLSFDLDKTTIHPEISTMFVNAANKAIASRNEKIANKTKEFIPQSFLLQETEEFPGHNYDMTESFEETIVTFSEFILVRGTMTNSVRPDHIMNRPLVLPERCKSNIHPLMVEVRSVYHRIHNLACELKNNIFSSSFEELEMLSIHKETTGQYERKEYDIMVLHCTEQDAITLALRGVCAKRFQKHYAFKLKEEESHKTVNFMDDHSRVDDWLDSDLIIENRIELRELIPDLVMDEFIGMSSKSNCFNPSNIINALISLREFQSLHFYERVMNEVAANMRRNLKKDKASIELIFRPIYGYNAYVVIRTTNYTKRNGKTFYAVFFKGQDFVTGIFEKTYVLGSGWMHTEFVSIDRHQASHVQGLLSRQLSLACLFVEQIADGLHHESDIYSSLDKIKKVIRMSILIDVEDNSNTSETLMQLRYYYMQLFSGHQNSLQTSQKITSKFPEFIRSKLCSYIIKKLSYLHTTIEQSDLSLTINEVIQTHGRGDVQAVDDEFDLSGSGVETPFGFKITKPAHLVLAAYFSHLRNKDEGESGYGSRIIMEKLLKNERQFRSLNPDLNYSWCLNTDFKSDDPKLPSAFQFDPRAVKRGCDLLIDDVLTKNTYPTTGKDVWYPFIRPKIHRLILDTLMSELASVKSSNLFNDDVRVVENKEDVKNLPRRNKCIEEMLLFMEEAQKNEKKAKDKNDNSEKRPELVFHLDEVMLKIELTEGGWASISIFKKDQHGGVRDIYILTILVRMAIRVCNDIFRAICIETSQEKLTDPLSRDDFIAEHYREVSSRSKSQKKKYTTTFKVSSDMSNWANRFTMVEFAEMTKHIVPPEMQPFCIYCFNLIKSKRLTIPSSVLNEWVERDPKSDSSSMPNVTALFKEFCGESKPELMSKKHATTFSVNSNMMQGIAHYVSSAYHVVEMHFLKELVNSYFLKIASYIGKSKEDRYRVDKIIHKMRKGDKLSDEEKIFIKPDLDLIFDFEISSDDEGILISMMSSDKNVLKMMSKELNRKWKNIKNTADRLFGVKTSFQKSTYSNMDLFEFNSAFYLKNSYLSALIKFVINSCYLPPQESVGKMVTQLYSTLSQIRDNGASGNLLCSISMCQAITYYMNLGFSQNNWCTSDLITSILYHKLSYTFYYRIQIPQLAGLVDTDFNDWLSIRLERDESKAKEMLSLLTQLKPSARPQRSDSQTVQSLHYGLFPRDKYWSMLKRLNINYDLESEIKYDEIELFLREPHSLNESIRLVRFKLCDPSMGRSLVELTRTDTMRISPYLLWSCLFSTPDGRKPFRHIIEMTKKKPNHLSLGALFPAHPQYDLIFLISQSEIEYQKLPKEKRSHVNWIQPLITQEERYQYLKAILRNKWFGSTSKLKQRVIDVYWEELKQEMPFLKESTNLSQQHQPDFVADGPILTMKDQRSPFPDTNSLISFIRSFDNWPRSRRVIMRSGDTQGYNSVSIMLKHNISTRHKCTIKILNLSDPVESSLKSTEIKEDMTNESMLKSEIMRSTFKTRFTTPLMSSIGKTLITGIEDRHRSWVELIYHLEKSSSHHSHLCSLMADDLRELIMKIPDSDLLTSEFNLRGKYSYMKRLITSLGLDMVKKFTDTSFFMEFYIVRPQYVSGSFIGDQEKLVIRSNDFLRAKLNYETRRWGAISNMQKEIVFRLLKTSSVQLTSAESFIRPDLIYTNCVYWADSIWIQNSVKNFSDIGNIKVMFCQMPNPTARSIHLQDMVGIPRTTKVNVARLLQSWVSRNDRNLDHSLLVSSWISTGSLQDSIVRSMLRYCARIISPQNPLSITAKDETDDEKQMMAEFESETEDDKVVDLGPAGLFNSLAANAYSQDMEAADDFIGGIHDFTSMVDDLTIYGGIAAHAFAGLSTVIMDTPTVRVITNLMVTARDSPNLFPDLLPMARYFWSQLGIDVKISRGFDDFTDFEGYDSSKDDSIIRVPLSRAFDRADDNEDLMDAINKMIETTDDLDMDFTDRIYANKYFQQDLGDLTMDDVKKIDLSQLSALAEDDLLKAILGSTSGIELDQDMLKKAFKESLQKASEEEYPPLKRS